MQFNVILQYHDELLRGLWLTVQLSLASIVLGTALGIAAASIRQTGGRAVRVAIDVYVEVVRNTPFLIQLFIIFFGLPAMGLRIGATSAALIAMTINLGAYSTEIVRAGIESIHRSQIEAGEALGLTRLQVYRHVVLAPAVAKVWPSLCSQFVLMMLASSVTSAISTQDLAAAAALIEVADLPQLRGLHRGHPRLPGAGARPARPARACWARGCSGGARPRPAPIAAPS